MRFVLLSTLLLLACGESPTSPTGSDLVLTIVSGNWQVVSADSLAPLPLVVTVTRNSQPVAGDSVTFTDLTSDAATALTDPAAHEPVAISVVTDATGAAHIGWHTTIHVGVDSMSASVHGASTVTFTATIVAGSVAGFAKFGGDAQTAPAGSALATLPAVKATDQFGNAVPGVSVTFTLTSGGGSISGTSAVTDARGIAMLGSWTLGSAPGANIVTAYMQGMHGVVIPFTFTETGTPAVMSR